MWFTAAQSGWRRLWWSLAGRIWLTSVVLVMLMGALGVSIAYRLAILERSVNRVLSRNYRSIQAANGMLAAMDHLRSGDQTPAQARTGFDRMLEIERHNLTEPGEGALTDTIARQADEFFAAAPGARRSPLVLERSLADLIALNERAMFSADRHTVAVARSSRVEALTFLLAAVILLAASSYALSRSLVSRPLASLIRTVRMIDSEQSLSAMARPPALELAELADEFNAMIRRLQTDSAKRMAELDRERSKTEAIIESIEDGLIVLDPQRAIVHMNEVAGAILDVPHTGMLGTRLASLGEHGSHAGRLLAALDHRVSDNGAPMEFKVFLRGRDHSYLVRELPWSDGRREGIGAEQSGVLGAVVLLQDVTLLRDQEKAHSHLIATLSHELKTPLTSLRIAAELLEETVADGLPPRAREIFATLQEDVVRMQTIADDLLDASRSSAARIGVERRPILLDEMVRDISRPLQIQAHEKGIALELKLPAQPLPIWGDPIKLPWVITNLVGNALRYTPAGGRITIELSQEDSVVRAVVSDTGSGIEGRALERIFEPYAQGVESSGRTGSAGLGLYITKEIVQAHNGRIFVDSGVGSGTTFTVEIPLREQMLG
ncbi:MAG TPA: ATP-binding protein [Candidatus Binataceae bacterium]|jgi:NtrC-family two-component system sensor histidine kinase KinB|nr:ATP-binding protein [Candidatus Binataceae bacterium]